MINFFRRPKMFLKANASTLLTFLGAGGVVFTSVLAVKATPKAMRLLEYAREEKGEALTPMETVKVAGPAYIPSIVAGTSTIACIFGANILNKRAQAALSSAYALLDNSFKQYKAKVAELYGEDANLRIQEEIAKDMYEVSDIRKEERLFYDITSQRYFEITPEELQLAEHNLNKQFLTEGYASLNDFYDALGLDRVDYGDHLGWSMYDRGYVSGYSHIEFYHPKVLLDDGLECHMLYILTDPTHDYLDY